MAQHYARGDLEQAILDALVASGKDIERLTPADLSLVDEFHTGGRQATVDLASKWTSGPACTSSTSAAGLAGRRAIAEAHGCHVTGIDLTEDYVRTAGALAKRVLLAGRVAIDSPARWPFPSRAAPSMAPT